LKRKGWIKIAALLFCIFFLSGNVFAAESEDIRRFSGADEILDALPDGFDQGDFAPFFEDDGEVDLWALISQKILSFFTLGIREGLSFFLKLCVLILFNALFSCIKKSFGIDSLDGVFDFISVLLMALLCYCALENSFEVTKNALNAMANFLTASLSVMTVLIGMTGGVGAAAVQHANIRFVLAFFTQGIAKFIFPVLKALFGLSLATSFSEMGLNGIFSFFKKTVRNICVFFFTVISALLALQHALASASDSLTMRSVRFAAGNFIPVIGSFVGESAKTLTASFSLVKTQCGVVALIVLLCLVLQPILYIWVQKMFLSLGKALSEMLGDSKGNLFLNSIAALMDLLLALLLSPGCYFVFFVTLFLNHKGSI